MAVSVTARFTETELEAITAAADAPDAQTYVTRLRETFGGTGKMPEALELAGRIRAGEAVAFPDGTMLERDAPSGWTGNVLGTER